MSRYNRILWGVLLASQAAYGVHAAPARDLLALELEDLMAIEIGPSADASIRGLTPPLPGGQLADGGRAGFLGTRPNRDTPHSLTSYSNDFIRNQQAASVGDVLQYDPAVRVTRGFGNFQQTYLIRGLPLFSDDMAYNGLYGILPRQYLAAQLIERVEVLRGSGTVLFGAAPGSALGSGLGGAVNVVPKRAPKRDLTDLSLGYQSDGQTLLAADVGRRSDDQRWGLRLNGAWHDGDTAVERESQSLQLATAGVDFRGAATRLSMDVGYQSHHLHATTPSIVIAPGLSIPDAPDADSAIAQPWTYSKEADVFATLRAEHDFSVRLTGWIAAGARQGEEQSNLSAFLTVFNDAGDFSASRFQVEREDQVFTGGTGLRLTVVTGAVTHRFTLAANLYDFDTRNAFAVFDAYQDNLYRPQSVSEPATVTFPGGDLDHPRTTLIQRLSSIALADQLSLLDDHLQITLALRRQTIIEDTFAYGSGERLTGYDENGLAPLAAALVHLAPGWSAYLHYAEGLEQGDIAPAVNGAGPVANAGGALEPYQVRQWEAGLKYQSGDLGSQLALFRLRRPLTVFNGENALVEQGIQTHEGVEWTAYGEPLTGLRWLGGVSLLRTDNDGADVIGAPSWQGNLNLEWDVPGWQGLTFAGQFMATGSQYADAANRQKVPDWQRLDLGLRQRWQLGNGNSLVLRANLQNVSDRDQWIASGGYPGQGYLILGQPRTLALSTQLSF